MDRQRHALIEALTAKGIVLCSQYLLKATDSDKTVSLDDIDALRRELFKFVDQKDSNVSKN